MKLSEIRDLEIVDLLDLGEIPGPFESIDMTIIAERRCGLHDPANLDARVKWVACFREVVALRCPRNAVGTAIVSDIDLLQASARERLLAFILWKHNHYKP